MKQSAVEWLIEQLQAPCRGIPSHIIEQAKEMEKNQLISFGYSQLQYVESEIGDLIYLKTPEETHKDIFGT